MITLTAEIEINGKVILLNNKRIISISSKIFDRSDITRPSYGIISNTGELEFNDFDSEFLNYANQRLLTSDLPVSIFLNNTLYKTNQQIGKFQTRSWNYDNNNRRVSVSLKDDLEEWQDIPFVGISYNPIENETLPMSSYYGYLYSKTPKKYQMSHFNELDPKTKSILTETKIEYKMLKDGNLWEQWRKICEVCALYIYKNREGKTVCTYTYGS
jgi:hypothetical protein